MRIKDVWEIFPLPAKIKLFWDRITLTRTATAYFVVSVLHCILQLIFQVQAFQINVQATDFLASIIEQGDAINPDAFYVLGNDLRLCDTVPTSFSTSSCQVIWDGMVGNNTLVPTSAVAAVTMNTTIYPSPVTTIDSISGTSTISAKSSHSSSASIAMAGQSHLTTTTSISNNSTSTTKSSYFSSTPTPTTTADKKSGSWDEWILGESAVVKRVPSTTEAVNINGTVQVIVNGFGWDNESAILDRECLWALGWPVQILRNTKREDLTFIMFQIWLLGMSIVAILNESVPHTIASLLTHLVATGWAGFQIYNSAQFRSDFAGMTTNGACHPINLLPNYWQSRSAAEIPSLVLNAVALLVYAVLSWKLAKSFGWQTFKRVGASLTISRIYKIVLTLSIVIQLSLFFIVTSIALWLDQLWNGAIGHLATSPVYRPLLIVTLILLPPWLAAGWYSVRRERKIEIFGFLLMCLCYLAGWGAMFDSTTFRWTYVTWTFFGLMTSASVFLTLLSFILGIICRFNFGKGLPHYLNAQEPIEGDFEPVIFGDPEKVAFPSNNEPTFSVAFGPEVQIPPPPQGPRFCATYEDA
ncbi:hypothetical protein J3R82DRAFT_1072 [Butyriboletus roseoflavus]|nr:hypothetical protein J3R82DRAFT_1072 [Butyriboletus roseoflavus]